MLILLKDEDRVINTQCISEIFIRYDNKKCEYDLICTLNQAVRMKSGNPRPFNDRDESVNFLYMKNIFKKISHT